MCFRKIIEDKENKLSEKTNEVNKLSNLILILEKDEWYPNSGCKFKNKLKILIKEESELINEIKYIIQNKDKYEDGLEYLQRIY